jgi:hypothetical protein
MIGRRRLLRRPRLVLLAGLVAGLSALGGCSFMFVTSPRALDGPNYACTRSKTPPVLDLLGATTAAVGTFLVLTASESPYQQPLISRDTKLGLGLGFLALYGASAGYGEWSTSKCAALRGSEDDDDETPATPRRRRVYVRPPAAQPSPVADAGAPEVAPPPPPRPAARQQSDEE